MGEGDDEEREREDMQDVQHTLLLGTGLRKWYTEAIIRTGLKRYYKKGLIVFTSTDTKF